MKTHCVRGHEFAPDNTRLVRHSPPRDKYTYKQCIACTRMHQHTADAKRRPPRPRQPRIIVPRAKRVRPSVEERFWAKVEQTPTCWNWTGNRVKGHGGFFVSSRQRHCYAHRFAYELLVGPIPAGLTIDHLCRNQRCVNPAHLEAVTGRVNTLRSTSPSALNARKTECLRGHALTPENIYRHPQTGARNCRICRRDSSLRSYHRTRAAA